jgi:hypothetical protein
MMSEKTSGDNMSHKMPPSGGYKRDLNKLTLEELKATSKKNDSCIMFIYIIYIYNAILSVIHCKFYSKTNKNFKQLLPTSYICL